MPPAASSVPPSVTFPAEPQRPARLEPIISLLQPRIPMFRPPAPRSPKGVTVRREMARRTTARAERREELRVIVCVDLPGVGSLSEGRVIGL